MFNFFGGSFTALIYSTKVNAEKVIMTILVSSLVWILTNKKPATARKGKESKDKDR